MTLHPFTPEAQAQIAENNRQRGLKAWAKVKARRPARGWWSKKRGIL